MEYLFVLLAVVSAILTAIHCGELTFELPDNERQCFFEKVDKGVESTLEFQVFLLKIVFECSSLHSPMQHFRFILMRNFI